MLPYKNPYGGIWSQMREIYEDRSESGVVVKMVKVRDHLTQEQAEANGESVMHAGNEKHMLTHVKLREPLTRKSGLNT